MPKKDRGGLNNMRYIVRWELMLEASDQREAARRAQELQRDPTSWAHSKYHVAQVGSTNWHTHDLTEEAPELRAEPSLSINAIHSVTTSYYECPMCKNVNEVPDQPMPGWRVTCEHCKSAYMLTK